MNYISSAIEALALLINNRKSIAPIADSTRNRYEGKAYDLLLSDLKASKDYRQQLVLGLLAAELQTIRAQKSGHIDDLDGAVFRLGMYFWRLGISKESDLPLKKCAAEVSFMLLKSIKFPPKEMISQLSQVRSSLSKVDPDWPRCLNLKPDEFKSLIDIIQNEIPEPHTVHPKADRGSNTTPAILDVSLPKWIHLSSPVRGDRFLSSQHPWRSGTEIEIHGDDEKVARDVAKAILNHDFPTAAELSQGLYQRLGQTWAPSRSFEDRSTWRMLRSASHLSKIDSQPAYVKRQNALSAYELLSGLDFDDDLVNTMIELAVDNLDPESPEGQSEWSITMARLLSVSEHEVFAFQVSHEHRALIRESLSVFTRNILKIEVRDFRELALALRSFRHQVESEMAQTASGDLAQFYLKWFGRIRHLLLPDESQLGEQTDALLREVIIAKRISDSTEQVASILGISEKVEVLVDATRGSGSSFVQDLVLPVLTEVLDQVKEAERTAEQVSRPELRIELQSAKLPIRSNLNEEISVIIEVLNIGNAPAKDIHLLMICDEANIVNSESGIGVLRAKETHFVTFAIKLEGPTSQLIFSLETSWTDDFNQKFSEKINLIAEAESESSWSDSDVNPYGLDPVRDRDRLFGRDKELESLGARLSAGNSVFITGQKRVGKSSLVQVALESLRRRGVATELLPFGYLQAESVNGLIGNLLVTIHETLRSLLDDVVPPLPNTGGEIPPLLAGRWLQSVTEKLDKRLYLTLAIDDFDELPGRFFETEEGASFFVFLRALISEPWFALVLIGSEIMPGLMSSHGYKLNQVGKIDIGKLDEPKATGQLIKEPSRQWLEWGDGAIRIAHQLTGGNPYFATLLAHDIWDNHRELDRSFVHEADVRHCAEKFARRAEKYHFVHLWADGANGIDPSSDLATQNVVTLFAVSNCAPDNDAARRDEVIDYAVLRSGNSGPGLYKDRLENLLERGVLTSVGDHSVTFDIPIVQSWFKESAPKLLAPQIRALTDAIRESEYIADREFLSVSEGLNFGGKNISEIRIRDWVAQFPEASQKVAAFRMLQRLKAEAYIDEKMISTFGDEFRRRLSELPLNKRVKTNVHGGYASNIKVVCLFTHDVLLAKNMATSMKITKDQVSTRAEFEANSSGYANTGVIIVFASFDGQQIEVKDFVRTIRKEFDSDKNPPEILVISLASLYSEERMVVDDSEFSRFVGKVLDTRLMPFSASNALIGDAESALHIRERFEKIGITFNSKFPLGWPSDGVLLLFPSYNPSFLPPVFTYAGRYLGSDWWPLFEGGEKWAGTWPEFSDSRVKNIRDLLRQGLESNELEFKSSLRTNVPGGETNKELETVVLKVIASFLNSKGGTLLIGVDDSAKVLGLKSDYSSSPNIVGPDGFGRHLKQLLERIDGLVAGEIEHYPVSLEEGDVYVVECPRSDTPVFLKIGTEEKFFIRQGAASEALEGAQLFNYQRNRFPN